MTDDLGLIVEAFHRTVIDGHLEIIEDVILMATNHPCKLTHGLKTGMSGPPEPLIEMHSSGQGGMYDPRTS